MFNDFKIRTYSTTKNKLRVLKDIFDRLNLFNFNNRLNALQGKVESLKKLKHVLEENPPTTSEPTEFGFGEFLIIHTHNPEGKEIGGLVLTETLEIDLTSVPRIYVDNIFVGNSPTNLLEHNFPIRLSDYGIRPGIHICTIVFNGITKNLQFNGSKNSITILTFVFDRIDADLTYNDFGNQSGLNLHLSPPDSINFTTSDVSTTGLFVAQSYSYSDFYTNFSTGYGEIDYLINKENFYLRLAAYLSEEDKLANLCNLYCWDSIWAPSPGTPRPNKIVNILPQDFNTWYVQSNQIGNYPDLILSEGESISQYHNLLKTRPLIMTEPYYQFTTLDATKTYTKIRFFITKVNYTYYDDLLFTHHYAHSYNNYGTIHEENNVWTGALIGGLKVSSIPYDLLGTSF